MCPDKLSPSLSLCGHTRSTSHIRFFTHVLDLRQDPHIRFCFPAARLTKALSAQDEAHANAQKRREEATRETSCLLEQIALLTNGTTRLESELEESHRKFYQSEEEALKKANPEPLILNP
jgi:hypothetical protein